MDRIRAIAQAIQEVLGPVADRLGRERGFIQRQRKLTGSSFVRLLVYGWQHNPAISLSGLCRMGAMQQVHLSAQGLAQRFTRQGADFLQAVLAQAACRVITPADTVPLELLTRFTAVWLLDTTVLELPAELAEQWPGTGSRNSTGNAAALKVEVGLELTQGQLAGPNLMPGRANDHTGPLATGEWPAGNLCITDLGFYSLERFAHLDARQVYWLSRLRADTCLQQDDGTALDLDAYLAQLTAQGAPQGERRIRLGAQGICRGRLLIERVPPPVAAERRRQLIQAMQSKHGRTPSQRALARCDWTLLITNVPDAMLTLDEAMALYGARWQVELLFKLWKQQGGLGHSRSEQPDRIMCELYAKLLACLLQHWILQLCWRHPNRSLVKAWQIVSSLAPLSGLARDEAQRVQALATIADALAHECQQNRRRQRPNTWQTLADGTPRWRHTQG